MSTVNRETFLHCLESVMPGLAQQRGDRIEQSDSFVLSGGEILTFNEETFCRMPSGLEKDMEGAVHAGPLLEILRKLTEEDIGIEAGSNGEANHELILRGKRRSIGVTMDAEVSLPIDAVEKPKAWVSLPAEFGDAVSVVGKCASHDQSIFYLTCIHVAPKWIEAADMRQICRWRMTTGFKGSFLVRQSALKHVASLGMVEFSETEKWVHFRNKNKLILSCRRYVEDYPEMDKWLKVAGESVTLPKALVDEADRASVFSKENAESNSILVGLKPGKLSIRGQGVRGWYRWVKKIAYSGKPMSFYISPEILSDLVKRHSEGILSGDRLRIDGGQYEYVAALVQPKKKESNEAKEEAETD